MTHQGKEIHVPGVVLHGPLNTDKRYSNFDVSHSEQVRLLFRTEGGTSRIRKVISDSFFLRFNGSTRENIYISMLITVVRGEATVYGLTDDYLSLIQMLYNKYLIVSSNFLQISNERKTEVIAKRNQLIFNRRWEDGNINN